MKALPSTKRLARSGWAIGIFTATAGLVVVHALLLGLLPRLSYLSNVFLVMYPVFGVVVCVLGAYRETSETKRLWLLLASGLFLSAVGQSLVTYDALANHAGVQTQALDADFFFFAGGIPIMLAICTSDDGAGLRIFAWLDAAQVVLASVLAYLLLFLEVPFHPHGESLSATSLMYLNDAESWVLVCAVTLRQLSNPSSERKRFYNLLSLYLWLSLVSGIVLGYLALKLGWEDGWHDAGWGVPYLPFLGVLAFCDVPGTSTGVQSSRQQRIGLLIENISPALFTFSIALMTTQAAPKHPLLSALCLSAAVIIYGSRAAILQVSYARSQQSLTTAMAASEQASVAKGQFLANISHEIRTPMNGIIGSTELALDTKLTEEQRDFLSVVRSSAEHLLGIVDEILDFSGVTTGSATLEADAFELANALNYAVRSVAVLAHKKGLELTLHIAPDVPANLIGDRVRLVQVIINLLGNAIKFTERGEVSVDVTLSAMNRGHATLLFSVCDTGIGIPLDKQSAVFEAFQQVQASDERIHGGTGLGLAVCRGLVNLMGGSIWLRSTPGEGATVFFDAQFSLSTGWRPSLECLSDEQLRGNRVLIVDDNARARNALSELTSNWKMEPRSCDPNKVVEELERATKAGKPYNLVLLDETLPNSAAYDLFESIRQTSSNPTPIVMMMDCCDATASSERSRRAGIAFHVIKPIVAGELFQCTRAALGLKPTGQNDCPAESITPAQKSLSVLLVDDNLVNRKVASGMLSKMGHHIETATNGLEALEEWRRNEFDLILMDVHMPQMNGIEATMQIRREEDGGAHVTIVAMTASAMSEDRDRCLAAGMDDFISKPVSHKDLFRMIAAKFPSQD